MWAPGRAGQLETCIIIIIIIVIIITIIIIILNIITIIIIRPADPDPGVDRAGVSEGEGLRLGGVATRHLDQSEESINSIDQSEESINNTPPGPHGESSWQPPGRG